MKILFLSSVTPYPPMDGDRQRSFHLLRQLTEHHEVHLLCFWRTPGDRAALQELEKYCASVTGIRISQTRIRWNSLMAWTTRLPLNVASFASGKMKRAVKHAVRQYGIQAVHAYRLRMAPYALCVAGCLHMLDYTDSLARYFQNRLQERNPFWKRLYLKREARRIKDYEVRVAGQFDACLISSPLDRDLLYREGAAQTIRVVTNGVDIARYSFPDRLTPEPRLIFVGNMQYPPNAAGLAYFCREVWPRIRAEIPEARFTVVGQPPASERERQYPGVDFAGLVPELEPYFRSARVAICPLQVASGRQFKVIEAFAAGIPAVATTLVAQNLEAVPERDLLVGDTPEAFARQVVRLCRDEDLCERLRQAARKLAQANYAWSAAAQELEKLYQALAAKPQGGML